MMKYSVLVLLVFFIYIKGNGQVVYSLQDPVTSKYFSVEKYSAFKGTPYIIDDWLTGSATTPKGTYASLQLKYNVVDNILLFNSDDKPYELVDEVISFTLKPDPDKPTTFLFFKKGIEGPDFKSSQFIQVLIEGSSSLYKLNQKQVTENIQINQGMVKTFNNNARYYIKINNSLKPVRLLKSDVTEVLSDKAAFVQAFIDQKKLNLKKETDLVQLLTYYNTL